MKTNVIASIAMAFFLAGMILPATGQFLSEEQMAAMEAAKQAAIKEAAHAPTPKLSNGKPDLSGHWSEPGGLDMSAFFRPPTVNEDDNEVTLNLPITVQSLNNLDAQNVANRWEDEKDKRPVYKTKEHQEKAYDNYIRADFLDPSYRCAAQGVPRLGAPDEIVQTVDAAYLMYQGEVSANSLRIVPTDGRKHDPKKDAFFNGDSIGYWEGDTLVVDVRNIDPTSWLDRDGSFHSFDMHVVERYTRVGNTLKYELRVEDPIFAEPFTPEPITLVLGEPGEHLEETYPCIETSLDDMVGNERH